MNTILTWQQVLNGLMSRYKERVQDVAAILEAPDGKLVPGILSNANKKP